MEHIEEAGIHSGDSACAIPPYTLSDPIVREIKDETRRMAIELQVKGLMNVQYAVRNDKIYVLEVNPRASRTVPFVSKATGVPLANLATKVIVGCKLKDLGFTKEVETKHISVKESVFPFIRFPGVDTMLGPEMKSTGEVMGIDTTFGVAYAKAQLGAGQKMPLSGTVFISVKDKDKRPMLFIAKKLEELGFKLVATCGTAKALRMNGVHAETVKKVSEGRPNVVDMIINGQVQLVINTPSSRSPRRDEVAIRSTSVAYSVPLVTTVSGASATVNGIECLKKEGLSVKSIQEYAEETRRGG
jgi:carbamoyl-phosphate synthase large subunit